MTFIKIKKFSLILALQKTWWGQKDKFCKANVENRAFIQTVLKKTLATPQWEDKQFNFKVDKLSEQILHKRRYKHNQ